MNKWKERLIVLAVTVVSLSGCNREEKGFSASGTFEGIEVDVGNLLPGRLLELSGREGDRVSRDSVLARIDCEKLELEREVVSVQLESAGLDERLIREKVEAARITLENDRKNLERTESLFAQKSATQQQLDDIRTRVKLDRSQLDAAIKELDRPRISRQELEARLRLLDRQIADSRVLSPIDGQITERFVEPGEVLTTGQRILRLADLGRLEIRVYLPARYLGKIKTGQVLKLRADGAPEMDYSGRVVWISPEAEFTPKTVQTPEARAELVYAVKLEVDNPDGVLKIGMPADVFFE